MNDAFPAGTRLDPYSAAFVEIVKEWVEHRFSHIVAELKHLVTYPSLAFEGYERAPLEASVDAVVVFDEDTPVQSGRMQLYRDGAYLGFFVLGLGWGGLIPLQEVIWATFFGRRYLGSVRSAGMPFSLVIGAGAPLLASVYFDRVGNYDGAFLTVAVIAAAVAPPNAFVGGIGERSYVVTEADQLAPRYDVGVGDLRLDLAGESLG